MATKTTTSKSTAKTATKRKAPAKKPPVSKEPVAAKEPAAVKEPVQSAAPAVADDDNTTGENAIKKALMSKDAVRFYVPRDPTSGDDNYFERSINGIFLRLKAGEVRELPLWLVEFIEERINIQRLNESSYGDYKTRNGKQLQ